MRVLLLVLLLFAFATPVYTQSNPPVDQTCGLPKQGTIVKSVIYTLKANCEQTGWLEIKTSQTPSRREMGAIGVIFYVQECPPVIEIWEVMPDSQGKFALEVSQNEIEAVAEGLVACSSDGRAAARLGLTEPVRQKVAHSPVYQAPSVRGGRDIQISLGPNAEGKVLHLVIDHALAGRVLGFVDTNSGEPPCQGADLSSLLAAVAPPAQPTPIPYAASVTAQPVDEDSSIVHVVQSGDTVWQIRIAYDVHPYKIISLNNLSELTSQGSFIFPGRKLLVRRAQ